jgi:restriction system protein
MQAKTINEAIIEVLRREQKPLGVKEIYKRITEWNLYTFKTSNPEQVVGSQLRRHCDNIELKAGSQIKHFTHLGDGTYKLK